MTDLFILPELNPVAYREAVFILCPVISPLGVASRCHNTLFVFRHIEYRIPGVNSNLFSTYGVRDVIAERSVCWCYVHEIYPTVWYRDYFGDCERIHLFTAAFMKMYFLSYYIFLFVVFVGIYGNLCDAAVGYSDSDGSVLRISRTFTSGCFHFGCIQKM